MNENQFTDYLIKKLDLDISPLLIETRKSVLYEMAIDDQGRVDMGVDSDTGEPVRGGGKGFQQDILIYEEKIDGNTSIIPRVIAEVKLRSVTTHDSIVYSEKARRIKRIYPFVRFGLILAEIQNIPGRVLRLGEHFDFIHTIKNPPSYSDIKVCRSLFNSEIKMSKELSKILFRSKKIKSLRKIIRTK
jgi:hypothetical protein